jgi:hypothetical protein
MEAVRGPNTQKSNKEKIDWKKFLLNIAQQPQNPLADPIRFELQAQVRKIPPRDLQGNCLAAF